MKHHFPHLEPEIIEYIKGFLDDPDEDIISFLSPLIVTSPTDEEKLVQLVEQFNGLNTENNSVIMNRELEKPVQMVLEDSITSIFTVPKRSGDISLSQANNRSNVDSKKLLKQEERNLKKKMEREEVKPIDSENNSEKSKLMEQILLQNMGIDPTESGTGNKDVHFESFDVSVGTSKILGNFVYLSYRKCKFEPCLW